MVVGGKGHCCCTSSVQRDYVVAGLTKLELLLCWDLELPLKI